MGEGASLGPHSVRDAAHIGCRVLERLSAHVITCLRLHPISDMAFKSSHDSLFHRMVIESLHSEAIASQTAAASPPHRGLHSGDAVLLIQDQRGYGSIVWASDRRDLHILATATALSLMYGDHSGRFGDEHWEIPMAVRCHAGNQRICIFQRYGVLLSQSPSTKDRVELSIYSTRMPDMACSSVCDLCSLETALLYHPSDSAYSIFQCSRAVFIHNFPAELNDDEGWMEPSCSPRISDGLYLNP